MASAKRSTIDEKPPLLAIPEYAGVGAGSDELLGVGPELRRIVRCDIDFMNLLMGTDTWFGIVSGSAVPNDLLRRIGRLSALPAEDELGMVRPSPSAISRASRLVNSGIRLPPPDDLSTDRDGAIRISWSRGDRFLETVFPFGKTDQPFIYHSEGEIFGIDSDLSTANVRKWMMWLEDAHQI